MVNKSLFIFGLGYTSQAVAHMAQERGFSVSGTCRTREKCGKLKAQGIEAFLFDGIPTEILENATHILSSVPPQEDNGDIVIACIAPHPHPPPQGGRDIKKVASPQGEEGYDKWLGYFSTTGVYGDYKGEWVDEESEPYPNNERLKRRMEAEGKWRERGGHIFRLGGIYGEGRSAISDALAGKARRVDKPGQFFSRIHVDDIAQTVLASMEKPNKGRVYNVCDNEPASAHEVIKFACELLGKTPPPLIPFDEAGLSPMGREFYSANRRVKNGRIRQELGINLRYPTYREGLQAIAGNMQK